MKRVAMFLLCVAIRPDLLTDAYVPLVIIGEGWSQQIVIQNVDDEEAVTGTLNFFDAFGDPWDVQLVNTEAHAPNLWRESRSTKRP